MERTNEFEFYTLGRRLSRLVDVRPNNDGVVVSQHWFEFYDAHIALIQLLQGTPYPLGLSRSKAQNACNSLEGICDRHIFYIDEAGVQQFRNFAEVSNVPVWTFDSLKRSIRDFEMIFAEELREASTYRVPDRGIFSVPKLVDAADQTFPASLREFIAEKSLVDWKSAGRCLAFSLPSASGFHVARAVEGTLERYYQTFCKKTDTKKTMNDYVQALEAIKTPPQPESKIVTELKQFKDDYRNPLMHPRVVLNETDAQMLFAKGAAIIMGMAQDLQQLKLKREAEAVEAAEVAVAEAAAGAGL